MDCPTGRTYQIATLRDLFGVPDDRLDVCLLEIAGWVRRVKADTLRRGMPASIGPCLWTDDGTAGFTVEPRMLERQPSLIVGPNHLAGNVNDTTPRFRDMSVREQHARQ